MWIFIAIFAIFAVICGLFAKVNVTIGAGRHTFVTARWLFIFVKAHVVLHKPGMSISLRIGRKNKEMPLKISKRTRKTKKKPSDMSWLINSVLASIRISALDIYIEMSDAANTAMCAGYLRIFLNSAMAILHKNFEGGQLSVRPGFNGTEKFEIFCILSVKPAQIIKEYLKKRGRKHAPYREFVADDYERA